MAEEKKTPEVLEEVLKDVSYDVFTSVEIRAGTIIKAEFYAEARKPAHKVWVDFGPQLGVLQTSAQITVHYQPEELVGKRVMGCVNLGKRQIGKFMSEFLLLGFSDENGDILLAAPDAKTPNGQKLH